MIIKKLLKTGGIAMVEALMAVTLIGSATIIMGGIFTSSTSTTKQSKDYLVAQNLMSEAMEGVINITSTNKILYPSLPECWLTYNYDECSETNKAKTGTNYTVNMDKGRWILDDTGKTEMNLNEYSPGNENFRLYLQEIKIGDVTYPRFTHDNDKLNIPSKYYRTIYFNEVSADYATFTVRVQWEDLSKIREVKDLYIIQNN